MNHNSPSLYPTNAISCQCRQSPCQCNSRVNTPARGIQVIQAGLAPKPFALSLNFAKVDLLKNLHGFAYIDPTCGGEYVIDILGNVDGFANLATLDVVSTNTLNLSATVVDLSNGLKDINVTGNVPLKVNGIQLGTPGTPGGYNFRTPLVGEIPVGSLPVTANAGTGASAGAIFHTIDVASVKTQLKINNVAVSQSTVNSVYNLVSTNGSVTLTDSGLGTISIQTTSTTNFFSQDSAASGIFNAIVNTNTQVVKYTGTLSANRNIVLNTAGATLGSVIRSSFIGVTFGAFNFNIVDQASGLSVETVNTAKSTEYIFTGTNWVKFS